MKALAIALVAAGAAVAAVALFGIACLAAGALADRRATRDDLMAVADAVQDDLDQPVPYVPVEFPLTAPDKAWLHTIGAKP